MNPNSVAKVPHELVEQIQLKLPPKSLVRFRSVCKAWNSLFRDSSFVLAYDLRQKALDAPKLLRLRSTEGTIISTSRVSDCGDIVVTAEDDVQMCYGVGNRNETDGTRVVGSCNGIICFWKTSIVLWNPSIREFKIIPETSDSINRRMVGFGYDPKTDEYKVVEIRRNRMCGYKRARVYGSRRNSWKDVFTNKIHGVHFEHEFNMHINGVYYWKGHFDIISFDMSDEEFKVSKLPLPLKEDNKHARYLMSWNERLAMAICESNASLKTFDIWVQTEITVEESWTKRFRFRSGLIERPLVFWDAETIFLEGRLGGLILYNTKTKIFKELGIYSCVCSSSLLTYLPSLVSINGSSDHESGMFHRLRSHKTCLDYEVGSNRQWRTKPNVD